MLETAPPTGLGWLSMVEVGKYGEACGFMGPTMPWDGPAARRELGMLLMAVKDGPLRVDSVPRERNRRAVCECLLDPSWWESE